MKKVIYLSFVLFALIFTSCKKTTSSTVTGTVQDSNNNLLEGVTITTSNGTTTTTDVSGNYTLEANSTDELRFAKTSYRTLQMGINSQTTINTTLDTDTFTTTYFSAAGNIIANPTFVNNSIQPTINVSATSSSDSWYTSAPYKGAIDPNGTPWYAGWSFYSNLVAGTLTSAQFTVPSLTDTITTAKLDAMVGVDTFRWNKNTRYLLDGYVFIKSGKVLEIEAGTIIQGMAGNLTNASALIITRGAKIDAQGTAAEPIIFTYNGDNGGSAATNRGQWGGLLILGKATINAATTEKSIEGIPTTNSFGSYGGADDSDNSGILKYVSIRHGGVKIATDNEINGLTLGAVGSGTTIEYVEIIGNLDDGIEWFGGTVNAKYLIAAFCEDDALDYDLGYRGKNQFVIVHQDGTSSGSSDKGGEHDGGSGATETAMPYSIPEFWNATFIGSSYEKALVFVDNAGGKYHNSIFTDFGRGIQIEDLTTQNQDAYQQMLDGNLKIENCLFYNMGTNVFETINEDF